MIITSIALLLIAASSGQTVNSPQPTGSPTAEDQQQATVVTSERLDVDNNENIATFTQNVHIKDPDGDMWADKMVVYFEPKSHELKKLISTGEKVIIITGGKRSVSHKAVYTANDGKIVLTGDPRITHGRNTYGSDKIIIFKDQEKTIFEPKARLILYSEDGGEAIEGLL